MTANMKCFGYPSGMNSNFSGSRLCVNSPPMLAYAGAAVTDTPAANIDFKCGLEPMCRMQQSLTAGMTAAALVNIHWALNTTAFTTDGALWVGATTEFSWWRWAVILVTIVAMAWGITFGLLKQDGVMVRAAVVGGILAWPAAEVAVWTLGHLLNVSEMLTLSVTGRGTADSFGTQLRDLANSGTFEDRVAVTTSSLLLAIGSLCLVFVFAFRNLALMVLVAFAPLAFMLAPVRPGVRVITVWASAVLALLITKPLTMGLLALILQTGQGFDSLWVPEALPLLFGLILSVFMPFAAFSLFDFVGTQAAGAAEGAGRSIGAVARSGPGAARQMGSSALRAIPARPGGRGGGAKPSLPGGSPGGGSKPQLPGGGAPGPRGPSTGAPAPLPTPAPSPSPSQRPVP